ncbi:MAG: HAD family phosphatase [Verrucomicrobiales bacterium]|nr:HAD family phosphatase [Verrucomicrobiales bacterium]
MPTPNAFLFDLGNVIAYFDFTPFLDAVKSRSKNADADFLKLIGSEKIALENGQMDSETFISKAIEHTGYQGSREDFIQSWKNIFSPNQAMIDTAHTLADHYPLFALSNTNGLHMDHLLATFPILDRFTGAIYSHEVVLEKPDPAIYHLATEKFSLTPAKTIYIDDRPENAEAGRSLGFITHQYDPQNHSAFLDFLDSNNVKLP